MEDKENSGGSANTSSDEHFNNRRNKDPNEKMSKSPEPTATDEISTEDLNLHLELDESGTLKETQDPYRMFSRIGSSPADKRNISQCDKETQDFHLSKSMDEGQFSNSAEKREDSNINNSRPNEKYDVADTFSIECKSKGSMKRLLDSQGKLKMSKIEY